MKPHAFPCDHVVQFITTQHVGLQNTYAFLTHKITRSYYNLLKNDLDLSDFSFYVDHVDMVIILTINLLFIFLFLNFFLLFIIYQLLDEEFER
jgi:hypothetical protein